MLGSFAIGYERFCRGILTVFVVNVALIAHTLLGLVVGGLFPSIAAAYATYRSWLLSADRGWTVRETWCAFHAAWRAELRSANLFGWATAAVWAALGYAYWLVLHNDMGPAGYASSGVLLVALVCWGLFTMLSWAVRANFAESNRWAARMALQMVVARPACSLILVVLFLVTVCAWAMWPGILMVFGVSAPILVAEYVASVFGRLPGMVRADGRRL
ncbi:DUF624 domain-containing protein [Bifidobacterium pullorum subsp. saeculare]|uniref:DUF624 domain-containing protein n=1 Tax=Bifidobacterium pullorum subsp. saeculare TaxID=78257 RepID=A0A938WWM4_9BIFI|nr:DUF624 domain-containing protein [Bifidobacterium pullorum]MBM6699594.1 DUF624 domain-containing protein [Bifidobacterium pullorum subsp. saeculare]